MPEKKIVIIIEDQEKWLRKLHGYIANLNCEIETFKSFDEAEERLIKKPTYHLVVTDIYPKDSLEEERGLRFAEFVSKREVPVIIVSGKEKKNFENAVKAFRDFKVSDFFSKKKFDKLKFIEAVKIAFEIEKRRKQKIGARTNIFVIHGHNEERLLELKILLKDDFNLNPIILKEQPERGAQTIIEKFENYAKNCKYAIALFTPDDEVEKNGEKYLQARPNVIYELGWLSKKLTRKKIMLLVQEETTIFSDFQGIIQIRFKTKIEEKYRKIKVELEAAGLI